MTSYHEQYPAVNDLIAGINGYLLPEAQEEIIAKAERAKNQAKAKATVLLKQKSDHSDHPVLSKSLPGGWVVSENPMIEAAPIGLCIPFATLVEAQHYAYQVSKKLGWRTWPRSARRCASSFETKIAIPNSIHLNEAISLLNSLNHSKK